MQGNLHLCSWWSRGAAEQDAGRGPGRARRLECRPSSLRTLTGTGSALLLWANRSVLLDLSCCLWFLSHNFYLLFLVIIWIHECTVFNFPFWNIANHTQSQSPLWHRCPGFYFWSWPSSSTVISLMFIVLYIFSQTKICSFLNIYSIISHTFFKFSFHLCLRGISRSEHAEVPNLKLLHCSAQWKYTPIPCDTFFGGHLKCFLFILP